MKRIIFSILILFITGSIFAQNGIMKTRYRDGSVRSEESFVNDVYDGTSYWFYQNGNLKEERTYSEGKLNGWVRKYYESGLIREEYHVDKGVLDGLKKSYYENGGLKTVLNYEDGKLVKQVDIPYDPEYQASVDAYKAGNRQYELQKKEDNILCDADVCPTPVGGMEVLYNNLVYPEHAKLYGLEGTVTLLADVNNEGYVGNVKVIKGIGLGCDEAAVEALKNTKFLPGQKDGRAVNSQITIKVKFALEEKSKFAVSDIKRMQNVPENKSRDNSQVPATKTEETTEIKKEIKDYTNFRCDLDVCPKPKGGLQTIIDNLVIPPTAKRLKINGEVIIIATVDEYGIVRDTKVEKSLGYGCDEGAEVAIFDTEFEPGIKNGNPVRGDVRIIVPVSQDKKK